MSTTIAERENAVRQAIAALEEAKNEQAALAAIPSSNSEILSAMAARLDTAETAERRHPQDASAIISALTDAVRALIAIERDRPVSDGTNGDNTASGSSANDTATANPANGAPSNPAHLQQTPDANNTLSGTGGSN